MLSIRIKKAMKKEMTLEEHLKFIYEALYEMADSLETLGAVINDENVMETKIKIKR